MASKGLVRGLVSVGSLDRRIARTLESRASTPEARINAIRTLSEAGIPTGVIVAPVIPWLTDRDIEKILFSAKDAGAQNAWYVMLRLPREIAELYRTLLAASLWLKVPILLTLVNNKQGGKKT